MQFLEYSEMVLCVLLQCMMSLELPATETVWFSVIFTLTSWITSSLLPVQMLSSDRCGRNLNGKTKLVFGVFLYATLLMRYNSVSCSAAAHYSSIIYCHINLIQHPHWMFASSSLFSCSYLISFTSLAMQ